MLLKIFIWPLKILTNKLRVEMAEFLQSVKACLKVDFEEHPRDSVLVEKKEGGEQQIALHGRGQKLIYSFDKDGFDLFPYFNKVPGLNSIADYIVFAKSSAGTPFALIFELKKTKSPVSQLLATKSFCSFLIDRINFATKSRFNVIIRMIGLVENAKGSVNVRNLKYDQRKILTTSIRSLPLEALLK